MPRQGKNTPKCQKHWKTPDYLIQEKRNVIVSEGHQKTGADKFSR